jgi:6-phosphogluconolactonase
MTTTLTGLRGQKIIGQSPEQAAEHLARDIVAFARGRIQHAGQVHWALSGGTSPELLYGLLAGAPDYSPQDWAATHLWQVDERCVPDSDPKLNFAMIRAALVSRVAVPASQVHAMPVSKGTDGSRLYERDMRAALAKTEGRLDVIVLGMGPDGHTASLFPHSPALAERDRWVVLNDGNTVIPPRPRMTLTYPVICSARFAAVLVTGEAKHSMLRQVAERPTDAANYPISGVVPRADGSMAWYMDRAAAEGD